MKLDRKFLQEILSTPTAPYREGLVMGVLTAYCTKHRIPHFKDSVGNLIVGAKSTKEYRAKVRKHSNESLRIFMAHTDHPGFHGDKWLSKTELSITWHGGSPRRHLPGSKVWLATKSGFRTEGVLKAAKLNKRGTAIASGVVKVKPEAGVIAATELFGGFAFRKPVWSQGRTLYTKAADDLIGSFIIASLAKKYKNDSSFLGILTRAEEVGFIGAIGHFELGWLTKSRRDVVCISLETSRTLPGALIGKGPIVRLGDRLTVFDPAGVDAIWEVAKKRLKGKFQRRIMDGGACEASASTAFGIRSVGISVPLGNYHNQSLEGGPDSRGADGPAPEFVDIGDLQGALDLSDALISESLTFNDPWKKRRREFIAWHSKAAELLKLQ